jgi:hypothetical protein
MPKMREHNFPNYFTWWKVSQEFLQVRKRLLIYGLFIGQKGAEKFLSLFIF